MPITKFKEPIKKKVLNEQIPERLRRVEKVCSKIYQSYVYNRTTDKKELEFSIYAQKYPQNLRTRLLTMGRARLAASNQFEINDECDTQNEFGVRECLVYTILRECMDPRNPQTNVLAYALSKVGVYAAPIGVISYDDLGNATGSTVTGWVNRFWIPFTKETVENVIKEHGNYRNLVLGDAAVSGNSWHAGNTYSVFNYDEWLSSDFETVKSACQGGFLNKEYGGTLQYLKDQDTKRRKLEAEIKEFKDSKKNAKAEGSR